MTNARFPELRVEPEMAERINTRLAESGQTFSAFARDAIGAHLSGGMAPVPKRRRRGSLSSALSGALRVTKFEDRDAGAVALARALAQQLDERPSDHKYLAGRLLDVLASLRLTPAARGAGLQPAPLSPPSKLDELRANVAHRQLEGAIVTGNATQAAEAIAKFADALVYYPFSERQATASRLEREAAGWANEREHRNQYATAARS